MKNAPKSTKHEQNHLLIIMVHHACLSVCQHFKLLVDELHVKGEAKIKNALKEAFKILNEVRVQRSQT